MSDWFQQVEEITLALVRQASVTGSPGELSFARYMRDLLAGHPYFAAHPDFLRVEVAPDDPLQRECLFAFVQGNGPQTVLLAGHYDVVSVANYGELSRWAYDPPELLPRLIEDLRERHADKQALDELLSGDYMPGRGALDMKSGLAAGVAVLYHFAAQDERQGNLLLMATPDEEATSHGMRAAVQRLPALCAEWRLEPVAAINLDSGADEGEEGEGRAVFLGSVGKLLPSVYVVGRETHAGEPFNGANAALLAAEITRRIECNPDLSDRAEGESAPPPTTLTQIDLKQYYDVTTPTAVWCAYNFLTHSWQAGEVLDKVVALAEEGLAAALAELRERAQSYGERSGRPFAQPTWRPTVLLYSELKRRALERGGAEAARVLAEITALYENDPEVNIPTFCRLLIAALWPFSGLSGPAAVVCLSSLYYPRVHVGAAAGLREVIARQVAALAAETGWAVRVRQFFPGISDMSFLGGGSAEDIAAMAANTPAWGSRIRFDYGIARTLDLPVVNIGPWGRDYHQRTERVNMPYSFGVVPELVWRVSRDLLGGAA